MPKKIREPISLELRTKIISYWKQHANTMKDLSVIFEISLTTANKIINDYLNEKYGKPT